MKQRFGKFTVELNGKVIEGDFDKVLDVRVDSSGLNDALVNGPGTFAWWMALETQAEKRLSKLKRERDIRYAMLYQTIKRRLVGKRPTAEDLKTEIILDEPYRILLEEIETGEETVGLIMAMRRSLEQRKENVLELARKYRAELGSLGGAVRDPHFS